MDTVKKIRANFHSVQDILLFIQIVLMVSVLPLLIKQMTVSAMMRLLTPGKTKKNMKSKAGLLRDKVEKYTDYILNRNFWIYRNICLKRSLALYYFLRKAGLDVQLCFGVRVIENQKNVPANMNIEGHSWLMYKGEYFLERNPETAKTYTTTYSYPDIL